MKHYPEWIPKYVEIYSNLLNTLNMGEVAKECNVKRETIFRYFKTNPDKRIAIDRMIYDNIKAQKHIVGTLGITALVKKLKSTKVSDKAIQMGLTVSGDYIEQHNNTNKYEDMKENELDSAITNLLRKAKHKREGADTCKDGGEALGEG